MLSYRWCLCLLILLFFSPILAEPVPDEIYALLNDGRYDEAEQRLRNDLKIMEKSRQGPYIELLAEVLHVQSEILISQGRAEEAYRKAKESVELNETVEGLCSLGKTFNIQLKLDEAIRYYRQALRLSDQLHGKHSPWSATVRTHLGLALTGTGDYPEALETYLELPPDSMPDRPLYLSYLYQELGQTDEALRQARMALEVVSALPEGGEFLARTILVTCLLNEGELEEAEEEMRLLVPSLPGYTEFQIVMLKTDLATQRGQLSEAEQLLSSLELPESEVLRARLLEERAKLAIARDKPTEAGMLLEEAVSLRGESSVEPHIWLQLGEIALLSGDPEKALDYADRAVDRARRRYGARHLKAASTLHRAADLYQVVGRGDKTEAALRASLDIYRETIGEEASLSQLVQTKLSLYELAIGKPLAEKSLKRCLAVAQTLSPEGKAQIEVLACLGLAQSLEGEEAVSMLERGLSAAEGPSRQPYLASLANTNLKAGNLEKARGYAETMVQSGGPPLFQATAYTMLAETHLAEPQKL